LFWKIFFLFSFVISIKFLNFGANLNIKIETEIYSFNLINGNYKINENTTNETDWLLWATRAYQSVYGYEFQGDNLLIARANLLMTFVEYTKERWGREPSTQELKNIANIIYRTLKPMPVKR